jgi:hypothetical protein
LHEGVTESSSPFESLVLDSLVLESLVLESLVLESLVLESLVLELLVLESLMLESKKSTIEFKKLISSSDGIDSIMCSSYS